MTNYEDYISKSVQTNFSTNHVAPLNNSGFQTTSEKDAKSPQIISGKNWNCDECPYSTTTKQHLNYHINAIHRKERNFRCNECGHSFLHRGNLNQHIKNVHNKQR